MAALLAGFVLAGLLAQAPASAPSDPAAAAEARAAQGDLAGAASAFRALLDDPASDRARALYGLAEVENRLGQVDAAVGHAREAASLVTAAGRPAQASAAWNLAAMAEFGRGNYGAAATYLDTAIRLSGEAQDWTRHAEQTGNLGSVYFFIGRYDEAARAFERARALADRHRGEGWAAPRHAVVTANQAALLQRLGRYGEALDLYRSMVSTETPLPVAQRAQVLVNQGALFRRLGDPYKALDAYSAARADFAAANDAGGEASVLTNRGIALALDLARFDDAATAFTDAFIVASAAGNRREVLLAQLYRAETHRRAGRLELAATDFSAADTLATSLDAKEELWKARYGAGRVALQNGQRDEARAAFDRAIAVIDGLRERLAVPATRAEFFQDKREVYDARIAVGLGHDTPAVTFALIEQSRARAWRERLSLGPVSLATVQPRLPDGAVLLAYWTGAEGAAVVRVTRTEARVVPLTIDLSQVAALDRTLRQAGDDAWRAPAAALGAALLPGDLARPATRIIVVPDGALGAVPFDALLVDGAPLVTRAAVSTLPTPALLQAPVADLALWRAPWTPHLAAFGDPLPGADTWGAAGVEPRLAASADEVDAIDTALGGAHQVFLGAADQKRALIDVLKAPPPVLHMATHAVADLAAGEQSRLLFSPSAEGGPADALFLREVYALPLTGVDLAVLSACETERGPEVRGEGVQGFSRGLLAAGARRAVTTLWRVPDRPTAALMRAFYEGVQAGLPVDLALAEAKRALLAQPALAHPHYWASFVLTGPTEALPRALRWRDLAGAALMGLGACGVVAWLVGRMRRRVPTR